MPPRKRVAAKPRQYAEDDFVDEDDGASDSDAFEDLKPAKKRSKKVSTPKKSAAKGKGARSAGKLSLFPTLPLDVLHVIFGHAQATDLLAFSWTSKALRNVVMNKSNMGATWEKAALRIHGIPRPPSDQSWPQWIRLLFVKTCYKCSAKCPRMDPHLRLRLCPTCIPGRIAHFTYEGTLLSNFVRTGTWMPGQAFPWNDYLPPKTRYKVPYAYTPHVDAARERLIKLGLQPYADVEPNAKKEDPVFGGRVDVWRESRQGSANRSRRKLFHSEMLSWEAVKTANNVEAEDDTRELRRKQIEQRLKDAGYDNIPDGIWSLSCCNQPRALTDRIWNQIKPLLEQEIAAELKRPAFVYHVGDLGARPRVF